MRDAGGLLDLILAIIALPVQIMKEFVFAIGNFIVFDVLSLGPFLPITL